MKYVYLIDMQDRCDANNNGEHIIEVYSTEELAKARCKYLNDREDDWKYYYISKALDVTEDEAGIYEYNKARKETYTLRDF